MHQCARSNETLASPDAGPEVLALRFWPRDSGPGTPAARLIYINTVQRGDIAKTPVTKRLYQVRLARHCLFWTQIIAACANSLKRAI